MSDPADFENDRALNNLTPDDDEAPIKLDRRSTHETAEEPENFDDVPDHDDGPEVLAELQALELEARRASLPPIRWANDADQPDFAHLIGAEGDGIGPDKTFTLTPEILELLISANSFQPEGPDGKIVFALRGGKLANARQIEKADSVEIEVMRPDHKNFRCTLGFYDRTNKKISAYLGSTVPNRSYMQNYYKKTHRIGRYRNINANILPTGYYVYRKNAHNKGKIKPAMRMTEPSSVSADAKATVLRTSNDLTFKHNDLWDLTTPYDNIHCAYSTTSFSSAGCQTICGADKQGPWGRFQKELDKHAWDTRFGYVLLTGREAAMAAKILALPAARQKPLVDKHLRRLRVGSQGPAVAALQIKMGYTGRTQYFGPATRKRLVEFERKEKLTSDSIFSPADDQAFGWNVFDVVSSSQTGSGIPAPNSQGGQPAPAGLDPKSLVFVGGPPGSAIAMDGKSIEIPGQGTWVVRGTAGELEFKPIAGFSGAVHPVTYRIANTGGATATASVSVNVIDVNKAPVVAGDEIRTVEGEAVSVAVLANDVDTDGQLDPTSVVLVAGPRGSQITATGKKLSVPNIGTWTVDPASGLIEFDPVAGYTGITMTTYEVTDNEGAKGRGQVTVKIAPMAKPPVATDDSVETKEDTPVVVNVLANDTSGTFGGANGPSTPGQPGGESPALPGGTTGPGPADPGPVGPGPTGPGPIDPDAIQYDGAIQFTEEQIRRFAPNAKDKYVQALLTYGPSELTKHGITASPMRLCHFMAQIGHESGGFTVDRESMNYTSASRIRTVWPKRFSSSAAAAPYVRNEEKLAEKVYGGRMRDLGNSEPGDGFKYRGRGLIQITGRGNYRSMGRKIGVDLEGNPDLATDGRTALLIAAQTWSDRTRSGRTMNQLADTNKIEIITLRINGGYTNLAHRKSEFEKAWKIWGTGSPPRATTNTDIIERGQRGEQVKTVQRLLVQKGYFPADEKIDGIFGGNTMKAVARFQFKHNETKTGIDRLNVNGIVDKATLQALRNAKDVRRAPGEIPRNARDPRNLQGGPNRRGGQGRRGGHQGGQPQTETGSPVLQLVGVLLLIAALALPLIASFKSTTEAADLWAMLTPYLAISGGMALIGAILLGSASASRPPGRTGPDQANRIPPPVTVGSEELTSLGDGPAFDEREETVEPDVLGADAPLHEYGFRESDFEESEPVRSAPALSDDVNFVAEAEPDGDQTLPGLEPEDTLEEPGAPDKRNAFTGTGRATVSPFDVSNRDVGLVLIKMFGGDNNLSHQVDNDLNEIMSGVQATASGSVAVIALADLENAPASIVEVSPLGERRTIAQLGEIDTGDPDTLANFVGRALVTYPNARRAIGFWDHGTGSFDEFDADEVLLTRSWNTRDRNRSKPARRLLLPANLREQLRDNPTTRGMLHDSTGGILTNVEAGRMLRAAFHRAGNDHPVDLIYSDTCLNGMIEVLEELGDYADCIVASSDTEPGAGWDYERWISLVHAEYPATADDWGKTAVRAFSDRYKGDVSQHPCTLAAFSTNHGIADAFAQVIEAADSMKPALAGWLILGHARGLTQGYDNRDSFDLIDFAQRLSVIAANSGAQALKEAADNLDQTCRLARLDYTAHGTMVQSSKGLAFWFPSSMRSFKKDIQTYRKLKFAQSTGWAEYLERQYGNG